VHASIAFIVGLWLLVVLLLLSSSSQVPCALSAGAEVTRGLASVAKVEQWQWCSAFTSCAGLSMTSTACADAAYSRADGNLLYALQASVATSSLLPVLLPLPWLRHCCLSLHSANFDESRSASLPAGRAHTHRC
jgi:hypothetical protein